MKRLHGIFCVLFLCMGMLLSCAQPTDGVVIVPSSRGNGTAETAAVTKELTEHLPTAEETTVILETETTEPAESWSSSGDDAALAEAQSLLDDAAFRALLTHYGADAESAAVRGAVAAVLAYRDAAAAEQPDDVQSSDTTVYWTSGGSVWHVTGSCSALAKSKSIQSGSESEALGAGKSRVCKRCGE